MQPKQSGPLSISSYNLVVEFKNKAKTKQKRQINEVKKLVKQTKSVFDLIIFMIKPLMYQQYEQSAPSQNNLESRYRSRVTWRCQLKPEEHLTGN